MIFRPANLTPMQRARQHAEQRGINLNDWFGKNRTRSIAWPRQDFWRELYDSTDLSMPQIGRMFGGRDHSTISYGIQRSEERNAA